MRKHFPLTLGVMLKLFPLPVGGMLELFTLPLVCRGGRQTRSVRSGTGDEKGTEQGRKLRQHSSIPDPFDTEKLDSSTDH